jgi:hypothetical protein
MNKQSVSSPITMRADLVVLQRTCAHQVLLVRSTIEKTYGE